MDQLEVIVTRSVSGYYTYPSGFVRQPEKNGKMYHEVITDQDFVRQAYEVVANLEDSPGHGNMILTPRYDYWLRFAIEDKTTLILIGGPNRTHWQLNNMVRTRPVPSPYHFPHLGTCL
jgi:hypothetical protein